MCEEECKTLREALRRCMYVASSGVRTSRHTVPINYHLQKVRRRITSHPLSLHPVLRPFTVPPTVPPRSLSRVSRGDTASQYLFSASCASWMMMHRQLCALFTVTRFVRLCRAHALLAGNAHAPLSDSSYYY